MFNFLSRLFLLAFALAAVPAADVDLTVGMTSGQTLTYVWSVVPPTGGTAPTITPNQALPSPAAGVTNRAKVSFATNARKGVYAFTVVATDTSGRTATDTASVTVNASQTITFPAISAHTFGDAPFAAGATSSQGLALSYTTSAPTVATVNSSGLITLTGVGSVTITASNAGDAVNFIAAASQSVTFTVAKGTPVLTIPSLTLTRTVGEADFAIAATSTVSSLPISFASSNTAVATVVGGKIHLVGAGSVTITISQTGSAVFNDATPKQVVFTVAPSSVTPTLTVNPAGDLTRSMGDAPFALVATTSSSQTVTYQSDAASVATISSAGLITLVGPGTAHITVSVPAGGGFTGKSLTITLTVLPAPPVITVRAQANPSTITLP